MKGLYVYGALLMGMCFTVGVTQESAFLVTMALVSASLAGLSEAAQEYGRAHFKIPEFLPRLIDMTAVGSWVATAATVITALIVII